MGPGVPSTSISPNFTVPKGQFSFYFYIITVSSSKKHSFTLMPCPSLPNIACTLQLCLLVKLMVLFITYISITFPLLLGTDLPSIFRYISVQLPRIFQYLKLQIYFYIPICASADFFSWTTENWPRKTAYAKI